jgi:hypothetical protein
MRIKLIDRIRGAIRGFKDPFYENVPFERLAYYAHVACCEDPQVDPVYYLCDGKRPECACDLKDSFCGLTADISHAKNFKNIGKSMNPDGPSIWVEMDEEDRVEVPDA